MKSTTLDNFSLPFTIFYLVNKCNHILSVALPSGCLQVSEKHHLPENSVTSIHLTNIWFCRSLRQALAALLTRLAFNPETTWPRLMAGQHLESHCTMLESFCKELKAVR